MSEVLDLTCELVAIPSVNPQERSGFTSPYGETSVAEFIYKWLGRNGLGPQYQEVAPGRRNVWALAEGKDKTRTLLLSGHMDTVDVQDMRISPFDPVVREGRLYGRGACDDKGPLACQMLAFRERVRRGDLPYSLAFLATCGEEYNLLGSRFFAANLPLRPTGAIFAEPTDLNIYIAHKGSARLNLRTLGQSAHSSTPHLGHNAIYRMARTLTAIEGYAASLAEKPPHPLLGTQTLAVCLVRGGQEANVVPHSCEAAIDWRFLPGGDAKICLEELKNHLKRQKIDDFQLELMGQFPPMTTDPESTLVQSLLEAACRHHPAARTTGVAYATDAAVFGALRIPTPVFGPGNAAQAHTQQEFIEIYQLDKAMAIYADALKPE